MTQHRSAPPPRVRRTRAEQKRQTREALVFAALVVFTRDGYHGASLDEIATQAGFSKGAVYSNFDGKAELFLAVMDHNLEALRGEDWDPFIEPEKRDVESPGSPAPREQEAADYLRGFALASLEFIATAARDDTLIDALRARVEVLLDAYRRVAASGRPAGEDLPVDDVAQLMAALDQGVSVLALSGAASIDGGLLRTGLRRLLLGPASTGDEPPTALGDKASPHPDVEQVRRLIDDMPANRSQRDTS